jgi:hypothetical protein
MRLSRSKQEYFDAQEKKDREQQCIGLWKKWSTKNLKKNVKHTVFSRFALLHSSIMPDDIFAHDVKTKT